MKSAAPVQSLEERMVIQHFEAHHRRSDSGRFVAPLPKKPNPSPLGESRSQAVCRFFSFERSLHTSPEFKAVLEEYFDMGHAEVVPEVDLQKSPGSVFYLPMHAVLKESSFTTNVRAVFDASAIIPQESR